jgi:hypothetical protein
MFGNMLVLITDTGANRGDRLSCTHRLRTETRAYSNHAPVVRGGGSSNCLEYGPMKASNLAAITSEVVATLATVERGATVFKMAGASASRL